MNKLIPLTMATVVSALLLADPVSSQSIVVTPSVSQQQFVEEVSQDLDRQLERAGRNMWTQREGITIVRFQRDPSGEPTDLSIYRGSGAHALDRVASRAVSRLNSLDQVPEGAGPDQVYQANIIFANSNKSLDKLSETLAKEEAARLASDTSETKVFAFGSAAARPTS